MSYTPLTHLRGDFFAPNNLQLTLELLLCASVTKPHMRHHDAPDELVHDVQVWRARGPARLTYATQLVASSINSYENITVCYGLPIFSQRFSAFVFPLFVPNAKH